MKKIFSRFSILMPVALALCMSFSISAQEESSATITGQVTDSTGAVVANANVVVRNESTGQERTVQTNNEGLYNIFPLSPGTYTVSVEQAGFKKSVTTTTLNARDRRPVDVVLEVGDTSVVVTVTDEPPLIQESATGQALVSGNQVTELPLNNRNFIRLVETVPGVSSDLSDEAGFGLTSLANVSINGLRRNAVNYLVDGVNNTDVGSNITLLSAPTVDSIGEVKILTSNYTAEIGRSGGGSVIITTRGGGNKFSGTIYDFNRNDRFSANSFFNNRLGRRADGSEVAPVPKLRYNNFGGVFSGPVFFPNVGDGGPALYNGKNKTFFFVSYEGRRVTRGVTDTIITVPTAAERAGDFSRTLGLPLCRQTNNTVSTACTAAGAVAVNVTDTTGATVPARQGMIFRQSDNRAYAGNIIPLTDLDPRSLSLLSAFPLPNIGVNGLQSTPINILNTDQYTFRIDHNFTPNHKIFGRFTRDSSQTREAFGLFGPYTSFPGIATTDTNVPGKIFAATYTGIFGNNLVNEATVNFSGNEILSELIGRGRRSDYAGANLINQATAINPAFAENNSNAIPTINTNGRVATLGALQGFSIEYSNLTFRDNLTYTRGNHVFKFGGEITSEIKNENTGGATQGSFLFSTAQSLGTTPNPAGGNISLTGTGNELASFLLNRAFRYSEAQTDFRVHLRFGRREFYAQDSWKVRPNVTLDLGVRYQYFVPPYDRDNLIGSFDPSLYNRSRINCTTAACTAFTIANSDQNNGIGIAGSTSRFGRSIVPKDYNNFSPRIGLAYSPDFETGIGKLLFGGPGKSVIRTGYGLYYDQVLVGIFEQAAFTTPAFSPNFTNDSTATNTVTFDNPTVGLTSATFANRAVVAVSPDFETPESQVWSLGIQREIFKNAVIDLSYVGTKGDKLVRRRNINFITPQTAIANGATVATAGNSAAVRPFVGYSTITYQETAAKSRYHGFLSSFNYRLQNGFTITLAYTFSKALTDSTNDRDAIDEPQNPLNPNEYALARTDRPHIFSASYVYELPFFRKSENSFVRLLLGGYQISGITQIESGAPVPRIAIADTQNGTRGLYPNVIGDPNGGLAGTIDPVTGLPFIYDPTVFVAPATGAFGNAPRSFARLPIRNQTNLALSKQFYFNSERTMYLQLRAESFNLFNTTQFVMGAGNATTLPTAGPLSNTLIARPTGTRLPREFQFGAKFYF